jgi:hypothetical protein
MGRPRKVFTTQELEERKKRWWGDKHNARRREKYAKDKEFRQGEINRMRVRNRQGADYADPREHLADLEAKASTRPIFDGTMATTTKPCFTTEELAELLGRQTQALYRWRASGKFPHGRFKTKIGAATKQVYTLAEARAVIEVLGAHFAATPYYHPSHTETRDRLFAAVEGVAD